MIDVKRFDLDFFSTNPTIIDKGNRLRVMTPRWRACVALFSGYRYLEVDPSYSEMVLYRRSAWFFKSVVRLPFNEIRNLKPSKFTNHITETGGPYRVTLTGGPYHGTTSRHTALWSVYLVLENQADMLALFQWKKNLGSVPGPGPKSPTIHYQAVDESDQERDFNRLVSRLCELTGKPLSWG